MFDAIGFFWLGVVVLVVLLDLWVINSVFRSDKPLGVKAGWALLVVVFPVLGACVWGIAGPRGIKKGPSSPEHSKG